MHKARGKHSQIADIERHLVTGSDDDCLMPDGMPRCRPKLEGVRQSLATVDELQQVTEMVTSPTCSPADDCRSNA